jgi:1A family penicillin-binding protein
MTKRHKDKKFLKNLAFLCAGCFLLIISITMLWIFSIKIPDFHSFETRKTVNSTKIYDRTGQILLYDINNDVKRTSISFDQMSVNIKNATVAIEDSNFYNEGGIRLTSIIRAAIADLFHTGKVQGGSTITQQLVKNTLLNSNKTILRKIEEWILAVKIDRSMTKEKILEAYLNESPYGGSIYGVEEAAKMYFGKDATDLDLAESAYLASLPQSPTTLSPYGKNRDKLDARKNLVLSRMQQLNFITKDQYNQAINEIVTFLPQETGGIKAPHFVFFIKDYLEQKYGTDMVEQGGLKVTTTLDYGLQQQAEQIVKAGALQNEKDWNASNAALVAVDPKTGQILTMVGSRDYFDKEIQGNFNVTTAGRQPGSSFKPFIYATAFDKGFTPSTVLFDLPTEFDTNCDAYGKVLPGHSQKNCYMPSDFDNSYRGPMTLRNALAQSINIVAVKLFYLVGIKDAFNVAEDMGISTLTNPSNYGLTLVIGGGETTLLDMTSAYGVFANDGIKNPTTGILEVQDQNGNVLEQFNPNPKNVLTKNTALTISDILSDNKARTPTFGANSVLNIPNTAVKTGTTNNDKDAWTIGYTPSISVGVWVGNNDNTPMKNGGVALAGPIWNKFMLAALQTLPAEKFEKPDLTYDPTIVKPALRGFWQGNDNFFIDKISGKLATAGTPDETKEEKVITNVHSILYWVDRNNITGPPPADPTGDSQFSHWEIPIQNWWAENAYKYPITTLADKPTTTDDVHTDALKPIVSVVEPDTTTIYAPDQKIQLKISSTGHFPLQKIDIFINNVYLGTSKPPFSFSFTPSSLDSLKEINDLKIISYDSVYNRGETDTTFQVQQ